MGLVNVETTLVVIQGDYGDVEGIAVACQRCDHAVEVFGTSSASVRRGCIMLRNECPRGENNFYREKK